jgi:hypothetical protein
MAGDLADRSDRGVALRGLLPRPVPSRYRFLDAEEGAGRGRIAIRLWVLGFSPATAWGFALATGTCWREHLPDVYRGRLVDALLDGEVIRRRLWDVVVASDLYREIVEDLQREAASSARL